MPLFLIIVRSTGSVLLFYHELDHWLDPKLRTMPVREAPLLDQIYVARASRGAGTAGTRLIDTQRLCSPARVEPTS